MTVLTKRRYRNDFPLGFGSPLGSFFADLDNLGTTSFTPAYEVIKGEHDYKVLLEVPGVKREDIQLNFERGILSITGEKKKVEEHSESSTRIYSSFKESFRLPDDVNEDEISAKLEEGVLEITLKRTEKKKTHIEIA